MRNIIVNAATPSARTASMSPNKNNNTGGTRGRAALTFGDAARAGEKQVLAHSFAMLAVTIALLVISAPTLWPQLFAG